MRDFRKKKHVSNEIDGQDTIYYLLFIVLYVNPQCYSISKLVCNKVGQTYGSSINTTYGEAKFLLRRFTYYTCDFRFLISIT